MLASLAFELAEKNEIPHPFNKQLKAAGKGWIHGFLGRHPQLSCRVAEPTTLERAQSFNRQNVSLFF